jgi:L-threonylcarbamoyladenylate synthase
VVSVAPLGSDPGGVAAAIEALGAGQVVGVPTDTVYGLAVDPSVPGAVDRLFALKGRPREVPLPVLVASDDQVDAVAGSLGMAARHLADRYWPGALTLVVPRAPGFTVDLGGPPAARMTVGVRWPDHPSIDQLCRAIGPLAVTSANRHGAPPATTAAEVLAELSDAGHPVVVLDGGRCAGAPSTVVECRGPATRCLREGAVPWREMAGDPLDRAILD